MTRETSLLTAATRSLRDRTRRTFSSLRFRNYRLYFIGQTISLCGTWMQSIAQGLLVLRLTGSGTALGVVMGLQFAPVLFLAPYGGVLADRFSKRKLLIVTQSVAGALALVLGVLVATGSVRLWMLYVLALVLGVATALDARGDPQSALAGLNSSWRSGRIARCGRRGIEGQVRRSKSL